jgi:hypothetical protein
VTKHDNNDKRLQQQEAATTRQQEAAEKQQQQQEAAHQLNKHQENNNNSKRNNKRWRHPRASGDLHRRASSGILHPSTSIQHPTNYTRKQCRLQIKEMKITEMCCESVVAYMQQSKQHQQHLQRPHKRYQHQQSSHQKLPNRNHLPKTL